MCLDQKLPLAILQHHDINLPYLKKYLNKTYKGIKCYQLNMKLKRAAKQKNAELKWKFQASLETNDQKSL